MEMKIVYDVSDANNHKIGILTRAGVWWAGVIIYDEPTIPKRIHPVEVFEVSGFDENNPLEIVEQ